MERQPRKLKKDRTGVWVSIAVHVGAIGAVLVVLLTTKVGQELIRGGLEAIRGKKPDRTDRPPPQRTTTTRTQRKAAPDAPPPASGGRRITDAPAASGESFFGGDTRTQKVAAAVGGPGTNVQTRTAPAPVVKPPPKLAFAAAKTDIKQLLAERAKASAVVESFGTEQISKSGASDASDIIGRISGASLAEGKFAVVRGLSDRYTLTTLNGADIPSADPNRRAVQLDLFPVQFISKVDVSKTFQPDLPGGFAGGLLNIVTRSFPEKPLFTFSYGTSYNPQANLRDDFLETDQGSRDWLALDDGTRELPRIAADTPTRGDGAGRNLGEPIKSSFASSQMAPIEGDSPLNQSFAFVLGDTTRLFGKRLGILGGMNYKQEYNFYDDGSVTKYQFSHPTNAVQLNQSWTKVDKRAVIEYSWGAMTTLAYELHEDHQLAFNFLYVQTAEDEARQLRGRDKDAFPDAPDQAPSPNYVDQAILHWTERNLTYYQLQGKHELPDVLGLKMDWVGSLASTSQEEPDYRIFQTVAFLDDPENPAYYAFGPSQPDRPTRMFRTLEEDNVNFRMDWTLPLPSYTSQENSVKGGFSVSQSEQTLTSRTFDIVQDVGRHPFTTSGDPNIFLDPTNYPFITYRNFPANYQYAGEQTIGAWYGMGTWSATEWAKLVGGVRLESTEISVDTINTSKPDEQIPSSNIDQDDVLPAALATFLIRSNLQLRTAWSKTVVRPTYREISRAEIYDVAQGRTIFGNPDLLMSSSENYDLRLEWYPRPGELISFGAFMKKLEQPIELSSIDRDNKQIQYVNYDQADVFGFEIELRKDLPGLLGPAIDQFSIGFNYAYIKSVVDLTEEQKQNRSGYGETAVDRPMYDQPEFVINGDLTWDILTTGTSITLNGGVTGRKLVLVGLATPDEYEEPAPYLDVFITQRLSRRWKARFSAKNLLNPVFETTQTWPSAGVVAIKSYTKGLSFGLSLSYEF